MLTLSVSLEMHLAMASDAITVCVGVRASDALGTGFFLQHVASSKVM